MAARKLKQYVNLNDSTGKTHTFGPDDTLPAWTKDRLGDHVFEEPQDEQGETEEAARVAALDREAQIAADAAAEAEDEADADDDGAPEADGDNGDEAPAPADTPAVDFTKPAPRTRTKK